MGSDMGFSPEKGFFRGPNKGSGNGGGIKDDENQSGTEEEQKDKLAEAITQSKEIIEQLIAFDDVVEEDPGVFRRRGDEFNSLNLSSKIKALKNRLLFAKGRQALGDKDKSDKIEALSRDIDLIENLHQVCSAIFREGIDKSVDEESGSSGRSKTELKDEKEEKVEKQSKSETLISRLKKEFGAIKKIIDLTSSHGGKITEDEAESLIADLNSIVNSYIDPAIRRTHNRNILKEISLKENDLKKASEEGKPEYEKEAIADELKRLRSERNNPLTLLSQEFTSDEVKEIKSVYNNYVEEIKKDTAKRDDEKLSEKKMLARAKELLETPEFTEFNNALRSLLADLKNLSPEDLENRYVRLTELWRQTGIKHSYFNKISTFGDEGTSLHHRFKTMMKKIEEIEVVLAESVCKITSFDFQEVADQIKRDNLDFFRFADSRDPGNEVDREKLELLAKFKYWCFGSVFNNEHIVKQIANEVGTSMVDLETNEEVFKVLFNLLNNANRGIIDEVKINKMDLMELMGSFPKEEVESWVVAIYKEVGKLEVRRKEIKVELQTYFASLTLEINNSAAGNRAGLYDEWASKVMRRDELLLATTYNPEYGWLIRDLLDDLMYIASLNKDEVIVKRLVSQPILNKLLPKQKYDHEGNPIEWDYGNDSELVEIKQKVRATYEDVRRAKALDMKVADYLKRKLESMGEEVLYLPDHTNKLITYNSLAHSETGRDNLSAAIDILIKRMSEKNPDKFAQLDDEALEKTKIFTDRLFFMFDYLTIILTDLQKNTRTRSHNGAIEDVDRIALIDIIASVMHRKFRYPGNYTEAMAVLLSLMEPLNSSNNLYHQSKPQKETTQNPVYKFNRGPDGELRPVDSDYEFYFGKASDTHRVEEAGEEVVKYVRQDARHLNVLQRLLWEYYEKKFDVINKVPLIRQRGACEALGFSTRQILFLNPAEWNRGGNPETIWDYQNGLIDGSGSLAKESKAKEGFPRNSNGELEIESEPLALEKIDDFVNKSKEEQVTEFILYITAEEKGLLGILERLYAPTASGGLISKDELFSNKGIIDSWFKAWGRVKMFPSPVVREAFVTMSYFIIMRALHVLEEVSGKDSDIDSAKFVWEELINTLEAHLRDEGGLAAYDKELATLINLFCEKPLYGLERSGIKDLEKPKPVRIRRAYHEDYRRNDIRGIEYKHLAEETGPSTDCLNDGTNLRWSKRVSYVISKWLYDRYLKTQPNLTYERPEFEYDWLRNKRVPKGMLKRWESSFRGSLGILPRDRANLEAAIRGENVDYDRSPIPPKGDPLVQVKEEK